MRHLVAPFVIIAGVSLLAVGIRDSNVVQALFGVGILYCSTYA